MKKTAQACGCCKRLVFTRQSWFAVGQRISGEFTVSLHISRTVVIHAAPERVYAAITDFAAYERWNPWLVRAVGDCVVGADVVADVRLGSKIQQYHHRILEIDAPRVFHWCDKGWFTVLAYGDRKRVLKPVPEGTEYTVTLSVTGYFSFLVSWLYGASLEEGMTAETNALKAYLER